MRERAIALLLTLGFLAIPSISNAQALGTRRRRRERRIRSRAPGVTVEASSPALIEKVRTVVTDGSGQYQIVNLPPGPYTVTFALPGFSTFKRDGVEVSVNFTSTINAEMRVGAVEETITVTGESPIVDLQSAAQTRSVTQDIIKQLPGRRLVDSDGSQRARYPAERYRRRRRARGPGWCAGAGARQPERRRRVALRRSAHRQHVHQLEPDKHEPVAAAVRSGRRAARPDRAARPAPTASS